MLSLLSDARGGPPAAAAGRSAELPSGLAGLRVLVVEDEAMVAMLIEDALIDLGCEVIGPVAGVAAALDLLEAEAVDAAVLDVNLGGEKVFPVADRLAESGTPFLFSTGYGVVGIQERHLDRPVLQKPYDTGRLGAALSAALRLN
jgi:DNA-binding response OmpR family regulator